MKSAAALKCILSGVFFFFSLNIIQKVSACLLPQEAITLHERCDRLRWAARRWGEFRLINQRFGVSDGEKSGMNSASPHDWGAN